MSCGGGCRLGLDPSLLWLGCRPAAVALIGPRAWELPYALGAALKRKKKKRKSHSYSDVVWPANPGLTAEPRSPCRIPWVRGGLGTEAFLEWKNSSPG